MQDDYNYGKPYRGDKYGGDYKPYGGQVRVLPRGCMFSEAAVTSVSSIACWFVSFLQGYEGGYGYTYKSPCEYATDASYLKGLGHVCYYEVRTARLPKVA
jgi:hypothetical protein